MHNKKGASNHVTVFDWPMSISILTINTLPSRALLYVAQRLLSLRAHKNKNVDYGKDSTSSAYVLGYIISCHRTQGRQPNALGMCFNIGYLVHERRSANKDAKWG